jgi:hypothetical protein
MKRKSTLVALLLALMLGPGLSRGQEGSGPQPKRARTPDDYTPRTLKELAAAEAGAESRGNKEETMRVHGDILPSRVRASYAGSSRRLPQIKREVLRQWALRFAGFPEGYTRPYETELLFAEDGAEFWLAVRRDGLLARPARKLKRGDQFELFLIRVGAAKLDDRWEPVLLVESSGRVFKN